MKFIQLMPTIVGILTFISRINTEYESFKAWTFIFLAFYFLWAVEIPCSVELSMKNVLWPGGQVLLSLFFTHDDTSTLFSTLTLYFQIKNES